MNPLILVHDFHKKGFGLQDNTFLRLFEVLLSTSPCSILECSVKISPQGTHAGRFRLGYEKEYIQEGLHAIEGFLHDVNRCKSVQLNHSMLAQIINNGLDVSKVIAVGVGLDYKTDMNDAKVKYYLTVRGYPEKVEQVLSLHSPVSGIREYLVHEEFTFGIDMYFAGTTGVEIYLYLDHQDLNNTELMGKLKVQGAVGELIKECHFIHLSFENDGRRIVYFHPQRPTRFVGLLGSRQLTLAYSHVQILNYILSRSYNKDPVSVKLCLLEDEIASKDIQNVDLQYALTSRA